MKRFKQEEIEALIANAKKPTTLSNYSYPLNLLDDRVFEVLTYSIFNKRIANNDPGLKGVYDTAVLMQGVGEKGMDCILKRNEKVTGIIQCKKLKKNLSDQQILTELVKFSIHYFQDNSRFDYVNEFKYYIATTTGYTSRALLLPEILSNKKTLLKYDLKKIIVSTIKKYKEFNSLINEELENEIPELLTRFRYELIRPEDYDLWINNFPEIIESFFDIKKVTDNALIEKTRKEIISHLENILSPNDEKGLSDFLINYKATALEKLNTVNFIGFDLHRHRQKPTDIALIDLFVQPSFLQRVTDKETKILSVLAEKLKIANIFKSDKNIIILGDPGAGKSLLVKFIMVHILNGNADRIGMLQYNKHLPLRIELRKYNEVRENKNVIEYISDLLGREYQVLISHEALRKYILASESLIFFDGLDEIFNVTHKSKMKEIIESFMITFPKAKCIVTSRFIGYHDIKFKENKFEEFAIQKFDVSQIKELAYNFYASQIINLEKRKKAVETCIQQIEKDVDNELKSNPLILTLILILASNNIVIPDSKLEIYEACTKTLVDSIDTKEKELHFEMPVKNKRLTFAHLAYWQYESLTKNRPVSYDSAIASLAKLLIEKREVQEFDVAEEKAKKFLEYAEKRSIYFEDNFTHKTFLEYYTADYLYINYFTKASDTAKKKVLSLITTYLPKAFWYIVFELLFIRVDKEQADSELMDEIFSKQIESNSLDVLYFLIANLGKFVNVSDTLKRQIIRKTILLCIKGEKVTKLKEINHFEENNLLAKINSLQNELITFSLLQEVFDEFENDGLDEIGLIELYILHYEISSFNFRMNPTYKLKIPNKVKIEKLAYKSLFLFWQVFVATGDKDKYLTIDILLKQIEYFGTNSLFSYLDFRYRENARRIDTFDIYLTQILQRQDLETFKKDCNTLLENGVKHQKILEHVSKSKLYFVHKSEGFNLALNFFLLSDSETVDEIIIAMIKDVKEMRNAYKRFKSTNSHAKLNRLDKYFIKNNLIRNFSKKPGAS